MINVYVLRMHHLVTNQNFYDAWIQLCQAPSFFIDECLDVHRHNHQQFNQLCRLMKAFIYHFVTNGGEKAVK